MRKPNIQNIPIRTKQGEEIRKAFQPDRNTELDFAALEKAMIPDYNKLQRYIKAIRNPNKRHYAEAYARWLLSGRIGAEPKPINIGGMAAQAVRMNIHESIGAKQ